MVLWRLYGEAPAVLDEELAERSLVEEEIEVEEEDDDDADLTWWQKANDIQKTAVSLLVAGASMAGVLLILSLLPEKQKQGLSDGVTAFGHWITGQKPQPVPLDYKKPCDKMHPDIKAYFKFCESMSDGSEQPNWQRFREIMNRLPNTEKRSLTYRFFEIAPENLVVGKTTEQVNVASRMELLNTPYTITIKTDLKDDNHPDGHVLAHVKLSEYGYNCLTEEGINKVAGRCKEHQEYMKRIMNNPEQHSWDAEPDMWFGEDILKDEVKKQLPDLLKKARKYVS